MRNEGGVGDDEGKDACKRGLNREDCALDRTSSLESGRRVIVNDEDGDDDVLDGEEEVLAIGGKGELVAVGVGEGDGVCERFKDVGSEGEAARGPRGHDCGRRR